MLGGTEAVQSRESGKDRLPAWDAVSAPRVCLSSYLLSPPARVKRVLWTPEDWRRAVAVKTTSCVGGLRTLPGLSEHGCCWAPASPSPIALHSTCYFSPVSSQFTWGLREAFSRFLRTFSSSTELWKSLACCGRSWSPSLPC